LGTIARLMRAFKTRRALFGAGFAGALILGALPASADKIKNPTAVFAGLDKITGRIITFEAAIDETVQFGSLQITPRVCYTRPPTEAPQTDVFAEVDDVGAVGDNNDYKRIFTGWMFAASPGLHGVEHPVYDIWLVDCKGGTEVIHTAPEEAELPDNSPLDASPSAGPPGANTQQQPGQQPPKKRKVVKPADATAPQPAALDPNQPFDAQAQPQPQQQPQRRQPNQRFFPTNDAPPVPPANIPSGNILNR
jgi:hypothetical protein